MAQELCKLISFEPAIVPPPPTDATYVERILNLILTEWTKLNAYFVSNPQNVPCTSPLIDVVTLTIVNTEFPWAIPPGTKRLAFQCRTSNDIRFSFVAGKVATSTKPYLILKSANVFDEKDLLLTGLTLYLASSSVPVTIEIITWS